MGIGANIKAITFGQGKTLMWLSKASGVSKYTIYSITRNPDIQVRPATLARLAKALNVSTEELIGNSLPYSSVSFNDDVSHTHAEKYLFDRVYRDLCKKDKGIIAKELIAYKNIEEQNRCFANRCQAGEDFAKINAVFDAIDALKNDFSYENFDVLVQRKAEAEESWQAIKSGIATINTIGRADREVQRLNALEVMLQEER